MTNAEKKLIELFLFESNIIVAKIQFEVDIVDLVDIVGEVDLVDVSDIDIDEEMNVSEVGNIDPKCLSTRKGSN